MGFVVELWLPILIGTVALWLLSFIAWAVLPHHFGDHAKVDHEDGLMEYLRQSDLEPGNYMFPHASSSKEQSSKEYVETYTQGPRGTLNVYEMPNMASNMIRTILYFFVTVLTVAYVTHVACDGAGADFVNVFRIAGTIGVLTYASSGILNRIWFKARMWTNIVDGVVYGIVLGLVFALMWPSA